MTADCHMHMVLDGYDWKGALARHSEAPDEAFIRSVLDTYRQKGITYLRDGGDRLGAGVKARELAPEYGIVYRTPLAPIHRLGHYGGFIGTAYENLGEFAALVKSHRAAGADFIKIMISGLMDFHHFGQLSEEPLPPEEIRELVHIVKEEGMSVMVHANGARTVEAAAAASVDSVEHGAYLDDDALTAMEEMGTVWVPTLSTVGNLMGKDRFPEEEVRAIVADFQERLSCYRGFVAPGTDAGAWAVPHGSQTEEVLLAQAGIDHARLKAGILQIQKKF